METMNKSSSTSAAAAICDHMNDWWNGNRDKGWVSMGVIV
jgi:malate dehydrogenase